MERTKLKKGMKFYGGLFEVVDCFEDGNYAAAEFADENGHSSYSVLKWQDDHWQVVDGLLSDDYWEMKANGRI